MSDFEAILRWLLVLYAAGAAGLPIAAKMLGDSARRAIWISRPIGALAFFFPPWFLSSVLDLPFGRVSLAFSLLILVLAGWHWFYHSGTVRQLNLREVLTAEAVTLGAFAGAIWLRGFSPDILNTEKPMDSAFLSSVILTEQMPPPDPWMAGESINYYYVGYAIHGAIAKVAGVTSPVAFNLALATTTAFAIAAVIGCALVIAPRYARFVAPMAGFLTIVAGNMDGPYRVIREGRAAWDASWWGGMGWNSSRVVYDGTIQTINEFPAFSIILGDLHPHLMALPFTIVALGIAAGTVKNSSTVDWVQIGFSGVLGGALYALNSWDFPTYFGLMVLALIWNWRDHGWRQIAYRAGSMAAIALLAWLPFVLSFTPFVAGDPATLPEWLQGIPIVETALTTVSFNTFEFTSAGEFFRIFGLFYILIVAALIVTARDQKISQMARSWTIVAPVVVLILVSLLANATTFILIVIPGVLAAAVLRRAGLATVEGAIAALFLAGTLIILLTELFFIQDQFHNRMNTLFKAYYQVWTLWGVAAAVSLGWMLAHARRPAWKTAVSGAVVASLVLGLVYPVVSATRWTNEFEDWRGLDGSAYIADFSEDELAAIEFIRANASPDSVLLEAPGCSYQPISRIPFSRVSVFTGVPTVIGWTGHEGQWRSGDDSLRADIVVRRDSVHEFYRNPTSEFVDRYGVEFIYYGIYEQGQGAASCDWAQALPIPDDSVLSTLGFSRVFQQGDVTVWQRLGSG